jgi:hypothetical protein
MQRKIGRNGIAGTAGVRPARCTIRGCRAGCNGLFLRRATASISKPNLPWTSKPEGRKFHSPHTLDPGNFIYRTKTLDHSVVVLPRLFALLRQRFHRRHPPRPQHQKPSRSRTESTNPPQCLLHRVLFPRSPRTCQHSGRVCLRLLRSLTTDSFVGCSPRLQGISRRIRPLPVSSAAAFRRPPETATLPLWILSVLGEHWVSEHAARPRH